MSKIIEFRLAQWLTGWTDWHARHALWVVLVSIGAALGSLYYAVQTLGINTDMLDEALPFRQALINRRSVAYHDLHIASVTFNTCQATVCGE